MWDKCNALRGSFFNGFKLMYPKYYKSKPFVYTFDRKILDHYIYLENITRKIYD